MTSSVLLSPHEFAVDGLPCLRIDRVPLFDVSKTFDCGQCFRFDPVKNTAHETEYAGFACGKYVSVAQDGDTLYLYNVTEKEYEHRFRIFLDLDRDYGKINDHILSLSRSDALHDAVRRASGIRILRQDGWEAICSFIISQNNNIPRIKNLIRTICEACATPVDVSAMKHHVADAHKSEAGHFCPFPTPEDLLSLGTDRLYGLKTGFRARYLTDAASKMQSGELNLALLENGTLSEGMEHLCQVKGIGPKVASCALLFGFGKLDAFPVDVWIRKATEKYFDRNFDPASLGQYAGIAQQYLFYYERYLQG